MIFNSDSYSKDVFAHGGEVLAVARGCRWILFICGEQMDKEITKIKMPSCPRVMLLLDFQFGGIVVRKEILEHMLPAASLLITKYWKSRKEVSLREWLEMIRYMYLISKLTAIISYRMGKENLGLNGNAL